MTTCDPKSVANFFLRKAEEEGKTLTPLQVIKLVYIAHGWHLGIYGKPLINEAAEAWQYGPVIPSLYHAMKIYGNMPVKQRLWTASGTWPYLEAVAVPEPTDAREVGLLSKVWDVYKKFSGGQLSQMTHQPNTPWFETWHKGGGSTRKGVDIPDEVIKQHYESKKKAG